MFDESHLEFDKILSILLSYCTSECARSRVRALHPKTDRQAVEVEFDRLKELKRAIEEGYVVRIEEIADVEPSLERAEIENSFLDAHELHDIRRNIQAMKSLKGHCLMS